MSQLDRNNLLRFQKADVAFLMQQVVDNCTSVLLALCGYTLQEVMVKKSFNILYNC